MDRLRVAQVDCVHHRRAASPPMPRSEKLIQPIDTEAAQALGQAAPAAAGGPCLADRAARARRQSRPDDVPGRGRAPRRSFAPMFFQMDSIGYNSRKCRPRTTRSPGASCSTRNTAASVALFGIDWLGMLDAAHGHAGAGPAAGRGRPDRADREGGRHRRRLPQGEEEGRPFPRHLESLWRAGEPDGVGGGLDRRCLVACRGGGRRQGHPGALCRRQGRLSRLVQRPRHLRELQGPRPRLRMAELLDGRLPRARGSRRSATSPPSTPTASTSRRT